MARAEIDAMKIPGRFTLKVKVRRLHEFRFRLWLGALLIGLGGRVIGMHVEISEK